MEKIIMAQHKKYGYWLNSGIYSLLQRLSVLAFGTLSFSVLARHLSHDHMGVWANFLMLTANIELIRWSIVKSAFIKYLSMHYKEHGEEIMTASLALNLLVTGLMMLAIAVGMPALSAFLKAPELTQEMYIFLFGMLLLIPFSHFEWIQNSQGDFKGIFVAYMVRQGSWFLMMVIHLMIYDTVPLAWLAIYYSLGILIGTFAGYAYVRKYLSRRLAFTKVWFLKLWRFGRVILGSSTSTMVFRNTDQALVSHIIGLGAVAVYNVSMRIINILDLPSNVVGDIMFPRSSKLDPVKDRDKLREMYERSVGAILAMVVPAGLLILALPKLILGILAGGTYMEAVPIVRFMLMNSFFMAFIKQFGTIMDSSGKQKLNLYVITAMAGLAIVFCYIFIYWQGLRGAVFGITATHIVGFCCSQAILYKLYGIRWWRVFGYGLHFIRDMFHVFKERINALKWKTKTNI
jgi:O-antigen/teichoic acid export membrane protein